MPIISMEYPDLVDLIGVKIEKDDLLTKIGLIGADVARVDGDQLDIEFNPNRPDLYSVEGVARAMRSFLGHRPGLQTYKVETSDILLKVDPSVLEVRPWVVSGLVKNITFTDPFVASVMDIQEKLHLTLGRKRNKVSIGIHDFDKVVPPFTYKAVDPEAVQFIPLGMNEYMDLHDVLRKHDKGREYAWTLEGFSRYPLIVDVNDDVISFPPIINGILTTVTENTTNIFLDITGLDLQGCKYALNIVATLLAERGGEIFSVKVEYPDQTLITPELDPVEQDLQTGYVNRMLSTTLTPQELSKCLERMGYGITDKRREVLEVQVPAYRTDILHPIDLVEDVAIGFGYENFELELPERMTFGNIRDLERTSDRLRDLMIGLNFTEVMTLTLSNLKDQFEKMSIPVTDHSIIKNPKTEDHTILRVSLLPSLLNILRTNKHRELPQKIFEISDVVIENKNCRRLAGTSIHTKANFTEIKSMVENIISGLGLKYTIDAKEHGSFIEGRCASISLEEESQEICYFGELHPRVITNFDLNYPVTAFEFFIDKIV
jgi:phenylalanyl-tRNA synthetase beta chain